MSCLGSRIRNLPEGGFFFGIPNNLCLIPASFCLPRNIPAPAASPASSRKSLMIPGTRESRDIQCLAMWKDNGSSNKANYCKKCHACSFLKYFFPFLFLVVSLWVLFYFVKEKPFFVFLIFLPFLVCFYSFFLSFFPFLIFLLPFLVFKGEKRTFYYFLGVNLPFFNIFIYLVWFGLFYCFWRDFRKQRGGFRKHRGILEMGPALTSLFPQFF